MSNELPYKIYRIKYTTSKEKNGDDIAYGSSISEVTSEARRDLRKQGHRNIKIIEVKRDHRAENLEDGARRERDEWLESKRRHASTTPKNLDAKIARIARGR